MIHLSSMLSRAKTRKSLFGALFVLILALACFGQPTLAQRGGNNNDGSGEDDDFDDAGFDDSGYNQPAQRDTDSSNHSPNNYSPSEGEDLDDDDDVDETNVSPQVAVEDDAVEQASGQPDEVGGESAQQPQLDQQQHSGSQQQQQQQQQQQYQHQMPFLDHVQAQNFYAPSSAMFVANLHPSEPALAPLAAYNSPHFHAPHMRYRRSLARSGNNNKPEGDIEGENSSPEAAQRLIRRKRHAKGHKYIGPVYTYVKTDKHANFKWGVKHKVGKHYG